MTDPTRKQAETNADLIGRYVAAVKRRLPAAQAEDIGAELREAVFAKLEAHEAKLGRQAEKAEVAEIIRAFGSPMLAASRYTGATHLIGPDVYPYYWPVVRIVVGVVAAIALVGFVVQGVVSDNPLRFAWRGVGAAMTGAWISFAITTVVFIVLDRSKAGLSIEKTWRPEQLPRDTAHKPKSLFESLFSLAWDGLFIAWWVGLFKLSNVLPGEAGEGVLTLDFSAAWAQAYWLVLAMSVLTAVIHAADVVHPVWTRARSLASAVASLIGLATVWLLAQGGTLFMVHGPAASSDKVDKLNVLFEQISKISLWGVALGFAIALAVEIWRISRSFRPVAAIAA